MTSFSDNRLDLLRVDESGDVGRRDLGLGKNKAGLLLVNRVEGGNGGFGPDDESTDVSTGSELEEVEGLDGASLDTWNVLECSNNSFILGVNDQRSPSLPVPPVPQLSLSGPDLSGVGDLGDVGVSGNGLEQLDGGPGLLGGFDIGRDDERTFLDLLDSVTSSENEGWEGRCSESRSDGVSLLVLVDLYVPFPPGLGRSKHSTTSAHVSESGLSGSLGTTTTDTGDTGNSSSSSPRLGRGLVTGLLGDGVSLSPVLGHRLVDLLDDIKPDGSGENSWQRKGAGALSLSRED